MNISLCPGLALILFRNLTAATQIYPSYKMKSKNCCLCGQHHSGNRRHFIKSLLLGTVSFAFWQTALPARGANHKAKALVLSCIDFRFLSAERYFLGIKNLGNEYDWTALAGASLALSGFPHQADAQAFWDQLEISHKLHKVGKVIIIDHQDCGAYAIKIDPDLSQDPLRELRAHTEYLNLAYQAIRDRYPDLDVELYFATLNPAEFQSIIPNLEADRSQALNDI